MRRSAAETSYPDTTHWQQRGLCRGNPLAFDLEHMGDDLDAIQAAINTCQRCPVLTQCKTFTLGLPTVDQPQELIQAAEVWTKSPKMTRRVQRALGEVDFDKMRAGHSQYVRRKATSQPISPEMRQAEADYQAWRKRERRRVGAA